MTAPAGPYTVGGVRKPVGQVQTVLPPGTPVPLVKPPVPAMDPRTVFGGRVGGWDPGPVGSTPATPATAPAPSYPGFTDYRTTTVGAPGLGGPISPPGAGPAIAPQNAQPTVSALDLALKSSVSPEQQKLRDMTMTGLTGLSTAPNRAELAAKSLALQRALTQPAWENDLRLAGQKAAALGRTGSGMTTTELSDLTLAREKSLGQFGEQAALDAAGQEMADRLGIFDRTSGYEGQLSGEDLARAGFARDIANNKFDVGSTVRGQRVGERDYSSNEAWKRASLAESQQARGDTNAWRGTDLRLQQQGRQDQQAQQAIENAKEQQLLQEQLLQGSFNRQLAGSTAAGGVGYANDPYQMQLAAAQQGSAQAAAQRAALEQAAQAEAMRRALAA